MTATRLLSDVKPSLAQTDEWLECLRHMGRKESSLKTLRSNVNSCLRLLMFRGKSTDAFEIGVDHMLLIWSEMEVKENVRWSYLHSLSNMVKFHTGVDVLPMCNILRNREQMDRPFITKEGFRLAYNAANPLDKVILSLGAYMGLRRAEIGAIRDCNISGNTVLVHGKGHGKDGLLVRLPMPQPVIDAIAEYRMWVSGIERKDEYLIQTRGRDKILHRLANSRISDRMRELGQRVGIRLTTHSLRRFFATILYYEVGCDLQTMKHLMRHAEVSTTMKCYINADARRAMEAGNKLTEVIGDILDGVNVD